jgi:signal transduction histidine kinase
MPDLAFLLTRDGTCLDYYARDLSKLSQSPKAFLGRRVRDLMEPATAERIMNAIMRAGVTDDPVLVEYELPTEPKLWREARFVAVEGDLVLCLVRDVTEQKNTVALTCDLAGRLITAQETERARIARDLHDTACQELASLSVDLGYVRRQLPDLDIAAMQDELARLQRRSGAIAESLRMLSHDLHPSSLRYLGLLAALEAHCAEVERQHAVRVSLHADRFAEPPDKLTSLSLFRIAQEAMQNAVTHGRATQIDVTLDADGAIGILRVSDDGTGFDVAAATGKGGLGLISIKERARLSRGEARVRSAPGRTVVEVFVPLEGCARS